MINMFAFCTQPVSPCVVDFVVVIEFPAHIHCVRVVITVCVF